MRYFKLVILDENATQFDKIAAAAHQKFNTLAATVMESMVGRKVMAAIVMTSKQINIDNACVVSLATGQYEPFSETVQRQLTLWPYLGFWRFLLTHLGLLLKCQ